MWFSLAAVVAGVSLVSAAQLDPKYAANITVFHVSSPTQPHLGHLEWCVHVTLRVCPTTGRNSHEATPPPYLALALLSSIYLPITPREWGPAEWLTLGGG
jgi:hypothetical protein